MIPFSERICRESSFHLQHFEKSPSSGKKKWKRKWKGKKKLKINSIMTSQNSKSNSISRTSKRSRRVIIPFSTLENKETWMEKSSHPQKEPEKSPPISGISKNLPTLRKKLKKREENHIIFFNPRKKKKENEKLKNNPIINSQKGWKPRSKSFPKRGKEFTFGMGFLDKSTTLPLWIETAEQKLKNPSL